MAQAAPNAATAFANTPCQPPSSAKFDWPRFVDAFAFDEALPLCDKDDRCPVSVRNWLGIREFSRSNYAAAEKWFSEAAEIAERIGEAPTWKKKKGWGALSDIRRYLAQRRELGKVSPEYVQRIFVLYPLHTRATIPGKEGQLAYDASACRLLHVELNFGMLREYVELFSRGKLSISVEYRVVDATVTEFTKKRTGIMESLQPWNQEVEGVLHAAAKGYDLVWFLYPYKGGVAYGGLGSIPLTPDGKTRVGMRRVWYPDGWGKFNNFPQFFHEYLHTVEFSNGIKITTHGSGETNRILKETGLPKGNSGETDYAEWHFSHTIPGSKTWEKRFGYPGRKSAVPEQPESLNEQMPDHKPGIADKETE
ncbi:MAG: hypothetical protein KF713_05525 [Turneriella sp.]|nr:hypothetical protein [Turneriella sp.]